ncbi:hypothetical protein PO909_026070 [Leuciscus waleckii]
MMDQYHILEVIGEGSFGRVFKGRRKFSGQVVALKFIPKVGRSEKDLRSLKREIDIMRGLKHPNIVLLLDSFETERELVVVTEYAEGELFQILEDDGSLPENQVCEIACQLVSALYYLHSHRILHRDMKPQNILLGKGGVVKLCDFGFARAMSVSTLVLTSIKGTPLYMSPELVEEKPYDHSADLWSLGCILYELHTGAPPFYTNSIFQLVQLIVRDPVKWPENMSQDCLSFLKGLLMKDPEKRLSWPDLLRHPFVADGVLIVSDEGSSNPLTVPPSPDRQALKHQQAAEKTTARNGEGKLLRKARELRQKEKTNKREIASQTRCKTVSAGGAPTTGHSLGSTFSVYQNSSQPGTNQHQANDNSVTRVRSATHKGQISRDYEREFPSVEVGPRQVMKRLGHARTSLASVRMDSEEQDIDSDSEWQQLIELSDQGPVNTSILPRLKTKLLFAKKQLLVRKGEEASSILQPLKILRNIVQSCQSGDAETVGKELELPHLLFNLIEDILNIPDLMQESQGEIILEDLMSVLIMYLEKSPGWEIKGRRAEDLCQLFISVFLCPVQKHSALLATAVLTLFTHRGIAVNVGIERLTSFLGNILTDTAEAHNPLPAGWGMCDGLLSLILHRLSECESSSLLDFQDSELWPCLWAKVNTTLENTTSQRCYFSPNGLYVFLSLALLVFSSNPYNCVALLSDNSTNCSSALSHLLTTSCSAALLEHSLFWGDSEINSISVMSCHLLCIPFSLELSLETFLSVLRSYQSANIVAGLVQMIQTLPVALVELPLCLLNRLLLSDPQHTAPCLITAAQASAFLPHSTESPNNGADHTQYQLNHFGNGVEQFKSNRIAKKTKMDQIKGDINSKKRLQRLKGYVDASKEKNYSLKAQHQPSKSKTEKFREVQPKNKIYPQKTMEHLREKIEQQSGCIQELMDSLEIHGSSAGRPQDLSAQQGCSISWLMDSLEELRRSGDHPKVSAAKIPSSPEEVRTASSLLAVLLQSEVLCGCAVELLILLSQLTLHLTHQSPFFVPVKITQLKLALHHRDDGIRAACCGLLGHLGSGVRQVLNESKFDLFLDLLGCLCDPASSVRRTACKAVGNWLSVTGRTDLKISSKDFKNTTDINALSAQDKSRTTPAIEGVRHSEEDVWMELAIGAAPPLASLLSDADNVIRQHCCGALGNLAAFSGGDGALLNVDAPGLILQTACNDSHHAVRRAAVATLRVFSQKNTLLQALRSLDAGRKLCRTSQSSLFQRDYQWLVSKLDGSVEGKA